MATISPSWTENVSLRSAATLAAAATATVDVDLDTLGADRTDITVNFTKGSSSGITVEFFYSTDSGTTDDDVAAISYTTIATEVRTTSISAAYVACKVTNDDGSNATGNIEIHHAWRQWTSA